MDLAYVWADKSTMGYVFSIGSLGSIANLEPIALEARVASE